MATRSSNMGPGPTEAIMEAHALVTQLYDPANQRNPTRINEIQTRLQQLQKGEHAWEIADSLLHENSTHHRFMGALTFTVKINVSGGEIGEPMTWQILERLVNHFITIVNEGEQAMVVRKLASSLVAVFRNSASSWKRAIWQLAASLAHGGYVAESDSQTVDFVNGVLPVLNTQKAIALVFFSVALAEEALRLEAEPQDLVGSVIERVVENIGDAFLLVQYIIRQIAYHASEAGSESMESTLGNEAMGSWKTWLSVYGNHRHSGDKQTQTLAVSCGQDIIEALRLPTFNESAATVLTSALETRSWAFDSHSIFTMSQILSDSIVTKHLIAIADENEDTDSMTFVDLLVAYVSHVNFDLFSDPMKPQNTQILAILHNIFKTPGYAAIDESATTRALEYWGEIAECLPDKLESTDSRYQIVKAQMAQVVLGMFNKLLYPSPSDLADWGDDERSEFNAFRHEACDYLLSAYPILGVELVSVFQESATTHLEKLDWRGFEAAMFCLAQLSEAVDENGHADQCLDSIFGSNAFAQLCLGGETGIPLKARQTLVDSFGKYESYFERHSFLLPSVLNILFESLNFESCAQPASRSILTLSKSCSRMLTTELPTFLDRLDQFRTKPTATVSTMPRVLEGIATIIQKLDSDQQKVQTLERILGFFVQEANKAREEAAGSAYDIARVHGHLVLSCIASLGRGLRSEGEDVINVDAAEEQNPYPPSFWNVGPGAPSQQLIMEAMRLLIVDFPVDSGIIDSACDILKAGYTESSGLFVFPPSLTVDFIKSFPLGISGTDVIMATASSFLASHGSHAMQIRDQAVELIIHVAQLFASMLDNPDIYDPETANAGIDFLARLLPKYYAILFSLTEPLPSAVGPVSQGTPTFALLLNFSLHALTRPEPLVLRSGTAFWIAMMDLRGGSSEETVALDQVLERFIPSLCETLVRQIAGRCARSDLTFLNDVLRRTVFKKMALARPSLTTALSALDAQVTDANGQQTTVLSAQDKSRFLESLVVARGAKSPSLEIVRSLWLKCRGMAFDYAQ
ncbi:Armadillo-like helical [Penicillium pulvis]|uniref:Armadillo-like helical n=1 Tax=Penicillium pulvis TaxID=1562058 RepID=UPI0025473AC6|nr:Armadillo-like helical [Penicillium pulvis]KAJ5784668.1 Armadillo-like helical [Penicillium pulvis]